jgi:HEAT repeat protein
MLSRAALVAAAAFAIGGLCAAGCKDPDQGIQSSNPNDVAKSVGELAKRGTDEAVEQISRAATHADSMVATEAVRSLGSMRQPKAVEALRRVAAEEKRPDVREAAVLELGRQTCDPQVRLLEETLQRDPEPRVRAAAASSLARLKAWDTLALLMDVAEKDPDLMVQSRAVAAVETMIGLKFGYDAHAPPAERQKALARMRSIAMTAAATLKQGETRRRGRR